MSAACHEVVCHDSPGSFSRQDGYSVGKVKKFISHV